MAETTPLAAWLNSPRPGHQLVAWHGTQQWTMAHLRQDVAQLVPALQGTTASRWALCFEDSYLFTVALLATLHAGKTPVIPGHNRIALLQEQAGLFDGLLSDQPLTGDGQVQQAPALQVPGLQVPAWQAPVLQVNSCDRPASDWQPLPPPPDEAYVELFTSGSTGQPRAIRKSLRALDNEAALLAAHFGERLQGCRIIASVVPQHLYGLTFRIMLPLALGLPFHASMLYYAEQLAALDPACRYAFISSPAFLKRLDPALPCPPLALLQSAGGLLPWTDACRCRQILHRDVEEIYGSTETGILAWRQRLQDDAPWTPFPGVTLSARADHWLARSPLIEDPAGCELGDQLQPYPDGQFVLRGRRDNIVKIEEKRVSLTDIEQRLLALDGVMDAAALPIEREGRQGIGAVLVLDTAARERWQQESPTQQKMAWRQALRRWLEPVAVPRYWRVVEAIPVNSMNKRVHARLLELFHDAP